jgi:ADP-heptose:LPS heptosyltransferase
MYTRLVHRPRQLRPRHSVENQWDLLSEVDTAFARPADPAIDRMEMPVDPAARDRVRQRLAEWGVPDEGCIIILHVSAGNPFRRWPESSFSALASGLIAQAPNRWVLVTGGPSDREATARVIDETRRLAAAQATRVIDAESLSLVELRAAVERASLYVGGDSGPLHVAGTSDVPVVGLYGPTLPERSAPWRPRSIPTESVDVGVLPCRPCHQRTCEPGDFRCLTGITAARVLDAAERLLEQAR